MLVGVLHWVTIRYHASGCGALGYHKYAKVLFGERTLMYGSLSLQLKAIQQAVSDVETALKGISDDLLDETCKQ